jgi:hypothetical protein
MHRRGTRNEGEMLNGLEFEAKRSNGIHYKFKT